MQVEYVRGWGKLASGTEVEVSLADGGSTTVKGKSIILATGSDVAPLPGVPIDEEKCAVLAFVEVASEQQDRRQ